MPERPPVLGPPGPGRRFDARRPVRVGDVLPSGEARLDALARYLQDVAGDDGRDAGIDAHLTWVVRRTAMVLTRRPHFTEVVDLVTWASGTGSRWAERRTTIAVGGDVAVEASSLWVCIDMATGRPTRLSDRFWAMYGEAVGAVTVSSRLRHADPPPGSWQRARCWPLRLADVDVLDHVNNAATWMAVDDELQRLAPRRPLAWIELEHRDAINADADVRVVGELHAPTGGGVAGDVVRIWLLTSDGVRASALGRFAPS